MKVASSYNNPKTNLRTKCINTKPPTKEKKRRETNTLRIVYSVRSNNDFLQGKEISPLYYDKSVTKRLQEISLQVPKEPTIISTPFSNHSKLIFFFKVNLIYQFLKNNIFFYIFSPLINLLPSSPLTMIRVLQRGYKKLAYKLPKNQP